MSRPLRIASLTLLLLAALVLGACGGGSNDIEAKNTYVRELNAAQTEFARSADDISKQRVPDRASAKIRLVQRFTGAIDEIVGKLQDIEVPGAVRIEHQQLIDVMTGFRADVRKLTQTYRRGDRDKVEAAVSAFSAARAQVGARINAALEAINSKLAAS
jgi:ABC-type uncharacterized transport system auxiliary subunit